ncbi:MAG TPA: pectinesterase family protein [Polyangiaceae bacterium]|jgi:pectin methylesterase-like acyl-CoA thioesterase
MELGSAVVRGAVLAAVCACFTACSADDGHSSDDDGGAATGHDAGSGAAETGGEDAGGTTDASPARDASPAAVDAGADATLDASPDATGGHAEAGGDASHDGEAGTSRPGSEGGPSTDAASGASDASTNGDAGTAAGSGPLPGGLLGFPAPNARNLCADPTLRITFTKPPTLGTSGKIQVFDASAPATAVAVLDMAATAFTDTVGGTLFNTLRPAYVDGNSAVFHLPSHPLAYGKTYYVTVDSGAVTGPNGAVSITGTTTWRFSTAATAPAASAALSVAFDGSSPFCSVQGALDAIPANNKTAVAVTVAAGTYHEIIHFASKSNVTLQGADRAATILSAENNSNLNASTSTRSLVGIDDSSGLVVQTLTIQNTTPQGGSQAEALRLEGCDECVVRNANILSLQDTLLWDGRIYADNCLIAGNVDFVWGGGTAYFNNCEIRDVGEAGWNVQARNPATTYGYVFVDSKLTASPTTITNHGLARIDVSQFPNSHVAYINCTLGSHIGAIGWTITGGTPTSALRFWEYQSVDPTGKLVDVSGRAAGSLQLTAAQAAMMRDPTVVLAGWQPPTN